LCFVFFFFFFQAEDGIRDRNVTGVQTCALPICECESAACSPVVEDRRQIRIHDRASRFAFDPEDRGPRTRTAAAPGHYGRRPPRSEERRVGKERRSRGGREEEKEQAEVVVGSRA